MMMMMMMIQSRMRKSHSASQAGMSNNMVLFHHDVLYYIRAKLKCWSHCWLRIILRRRTITGSWRRGALNKKSTL